jgi:hypothetical protein
MKSHVSQPGDRIRVAEHGQESLKIATVRLFGENSCGDIFSLSDGAARMQSHGPSSRVRGGTNLFPYLLFETHDI